MSHEAALGQIRSMLVGEPLVNSVRAADMEMFEFGSLVRRTTTGQPHIVARGSGIKIEPPVPEARTLPRIERAW